MPKSRPILIVEDNLADQFLIKQSFREANIKNELVFANNGTEALDMIIKKSIRPFMIIADINMPSMNGFDLKKKLDAHDHLNTIPFIYMTYSIDPAEIKRAYDLKVQGYFEKRDIEEQTLLVEVIIEYWKNAQIPEKA